MFFRIKKSGGRAYVQVVENKRVDGAVRQSVIANLGRADDLIASGALASLLASGAKLTEQVLLINALDEDADGSSKRMVDLATGNASEPTPDEGKDPAAVSLGRRGGLKGGVARAAKMSPERRAEIAKKAAQARWGKDR